MALAALAVAVIATAWLRGAFAPRAAEGGVTALAVMPLQNLTGQPAGAHLAEALTADLNRDLQNFQVLVKGRQSAADWPG